MLLVAAPSLFRQGLLGLLRQRWPQLLLTLTADATQVAALVARRPFGAVVLDGGGLPGPALPRLLAQVRQVRPAQRLLLLADARHPRPPAGPHPALVLPRHVLPQALAAALAPWLDGAPGLAATPVAARPSRAPAVATAFSPRELEVLRLVVDDYCNREIAGHLYLSVRTVESHRRALLQKSGARTLVGLVAWALRAGVVA
ncbi:DNA-binding response regulator [Hymenobacter nivis]|uniref:DNA-binding response regulator n=1 Tax=Hymenobacter nivis TaxID=1850093 RepID=A0A502GN45_9BACT|nr:DNA-binding response regulator [Hymenobacter nivis]